MNKTLSKKETFNEDGKQGNGIESDWGNFNPGVVSDVLSEGVTLLLRLE